MFQAFTTFMVAFGAVTLAEMGDKTQLLAMCFATRFNAKKVLWGVFIATILNHGLAVALGYFLKSILAPYSVYIQLAASISFIGFALWTIKGDKVDDSCDTKKTKYGPVLTVAFAFFIAEMGDKTQLATVSLAAGLSNPFAVLLGTTIGMLVADGIGIIIGVVMNKKIPENVLKWVSAGIFAMSGLVGYIESAKKLMDKNMLLITISMLIIITGIFTILIYKSNRNEGVFDEIAALNEKNNSRVT